MSIVNDFKSSKYYNNESYFNEYVAFQAFIINNGIKIDKMIDESEFDKLVKTDKFT